MKINRQVWSWCMYDWANSAFATTIMAGFFPGFFKKFWCVGVEPAVSTFRLGMGDAAGGLLIALLSPVIGALAGTYRIKKQLLLASALMGIACTAGLSLIGRGNWGAALAVYILAWIGFTFANLFYDSLLPDVAGEPSRFDTVSSQGFAMGYVGGGILLAINVLMFTNPRAFGFADGAQAVCAAFLTVSAWWLFFSIPLALFVRQRREPLRKETASPAGTFRDLAQTIREIRGNRTVLMFLIAYWLYIDGVNTIIIMATDFGLSIGIPLATAMTALILVQFVAFPASLLFGRMATRWSARNAILLGVAGYAVISIAGAWLIHTPTQYLVLAGCIGAVQGGVQALSRSLFAAIIPQHKSAEYFGFYNLVGRFAVVGGPAIVALTNLAVHRAGMPPHAASRAGIASISLLFIAGGALLLLCTKARPAQSGVAG